MANPLQAYQRMRIMTASPSELILLLYEGLIRFARAAEAAMEADDPKELGRNLTRALDILAHLQDSLAPSISPTIVASLDRTYEFWSNMLVKSQVSGDIELMRRVITQLEEMFEAWRIAAAEIAGQPRP
jgi:flagellar protein FliS